jgi:hypothetical protein
MLRQANKTFTVLAILFAAILPWLTASVHAHLAAGDNVLTDWHWRWDVTFVLFIFGTVYLRGWTRLRKIGGKAKLSQLGFYVLALSAIGCALLSPIDDLASYLLIKRQN